MQKFKIDNPFFSLMDKIGDLIILNILWLVCCLPVITAGAASTAMFSVVMKMSAGEDPVIIRTFFKAFRENFKQSTWTFLLFLVSGAFLFIDFLAAPTLPGLAGKLLLVGSVSFGVLWFWALLYSFPVLLNFHAGIKETVRKALLMSFQNLPSTLAVSFLVLLPAITLFVFPDIAIYLFPFFLIIGSSCIALGIAWFFNRIFTINNQEDSL